jgi:probable rRNA maturation factor
VRARASDVEVRIEDARWRRVPRVAARTRRAVGAALAGARPRLEASETSVVLTGDAAIAKLNAQWRNKRGPTDVLSFPAADHRRRRGAPPLLGDVVVAYGVAARDARAMGRPLGDHLAHLVVHGTLHLLGYDHETDSEAERMEALERRILGTLGLPDPYRSA